MALANGLTPKQDAFAMAYVETGCGSEAYRRAYGAENYKDSSIHVNASKLLSNTKVAQRVNALQEMHVKRHIVTVDTLTAELEEARQIAIQINQPSAMVSASMGKGKLNGLVTDKAEHTGKDGAPLMPSINVTISRTIKQT